MPQIENANEATPAFVPVAAGHATELVDEIFAEFTESAELHVGQHVIATDDAHHEHKGVIKAIHGDEIVVTQHSGDHTYKKANVRPDPEHHD